MLETLDAHLPIRKLCGANTLAHVLSERQSAGMSDHASEQGGAAAREVPVGFVIAVMAAKPSAGPARRGATPIPERSPPVCHRRNE